MRVLVFVTLIAAVPHLADAQTTNPTLVGTWQTATDGQQRWLVIFRQDGPRVVGIVSSCGSHSGGTVASQIYDVNVAGGTVRFKCTSGVDGRVIAFEGRHNSDEIEFSYQQQPRKGATLTPDAAGMFGPSVVQGFLAKRVEETGDEFAAAINLPLKNVKVEGELFVPPAVGRIASVLVLVNSGTSWDGMAASLYRDPAMRDLSADARSSLLLLRISNVGQTAFFNVIANASAGADEGLLQLLDRLALDSGRAELRNAPVIVWGHSRSSNFVATFAARHPGRTIAFVRYHAGDGTLTPNLPVLSRVPALLLEAGKEQILKGATQAAESAWKSGRALGAPWTFAIEPDATHQNPADLKTANALLVPWLRAVIDQRVPPGGGALQPIAVTPPTIWMGSHLTGEIAASETFAGPKAEASWLPDEASAQGWQIVLGKRSR